jgi:FixJ family two-component response regulator
MRNRTSFLSTTRRTSSFPKEAISRFQEFRRAGKRIDLLLTDLRMPHLCGLELLEALEELGIDIPVLVVTGYCDDVLRADLMKKGYTEFMEKPFEPNDLVKRAQKMLEDFAFQEEKA